MSIGGTGSFFNNYQNGGAFFYQPVFSAPLPPALNMPVSPQQNALADNLLNLLPNTKNQLENSMKELSAMTEQQNIAAAKDLLKFPENFEQMLNKLTAASDIKLSSPYIDLEHTAAFLALHSKKASSELYNMIAAYSKIGVSMKDEQLSKLSKLISFISAAASQNTQNIQAGQNVQSLKAIMLMYLPWLPLTDPDAFKFEINKSNGDDADASGLDSIGVLISTVNYGNLQAQILKTDSDGIKIEIISSETFPLKELVLLMQEESRKYSININFDLAQKKDFNKENVSKSKTEVFLNTSPGVNPFLLLISNALIKNTHQVDITESTRWKEKDISENGKNNGKS